MCTYELRIISNRIGFMYDWRLKSGVGSYVCEIIILRINSLNDYLNLNTDCNLRVILNFWVFFTFYNLHRRVVNTIILAYFSPILEHSFIATVLLYFQFSFLFGIPPQLLFQCPDRLWCDQ